MMTTDPRNDDLSPLPDTEPRSWGIHASAPVVSIPGYEIVRELHHGAQGIVYHAIQKSTKQEVAIKVMRGHGPLALSAEKQFDREIQLIAQLKHPNIISIIDSGTTADGQRYFVMEFVNEYVPGDSLRAYVRRDRLTLTRLLWMFQTVCNAVQAAHVRGVVHRDLKPKNILVDCDGNVKVADFGLAKPRVAPGEALITSPGEIVGTLPYMSPEQVGAIPGQVDQRTDVYALGVTLYELLTGRLPYPVTESPAETFKHIADTPPIPPTRAWDPESGVSAGARARRAADLCPIDRDIDTIVLTALAKRPDARYRDAGELAEQIGRYLRAQPVYPQGAGMAQMLCISARHSLRKHRLINWAAVVALAIVLTHFVGDPLIYSWTPAYRKFLHAWAVVVPLRIAGPALDTVRIIALTDETDIEGLADQCGLKGVTEANIKSHRRLHGRLMEKLAASRCKAVVWDITFRSEDNDSDPEFVAGVRKLNDKNVEVVVAVHAWWLGDEGVPALSPVIAAAKLRWGCVAAGLDKKNPWVLQLAAQRGPTGPLPSLALAAFAAARSPGSECDIVLDPKRLFVKTAYWKRDETIAQARRRVQAPDTRRLTYASVGDDKSGAFDSELGLQPDDTIGFFVVDVPKDQVLAEATIEYQRVFEADESRLREWFAGKIVLVGNLRKGVDRHDHPDGRQLVGCYAHAAGIDALMRSVSVRMWGAVADHGLDILGAVLGGLTSLLTGGRSIRRFSVLAILTAGLLLSNVLVYSAFRYLFNPLPAVFAMFICSEIGAVVNRVAAPRKI